MSSSHPNPLSHELSCDDPAGFMVQTELRRMKERLDVRKS